MLVRCSSMPLNRFLVFLKRVRHAPCKTPIMIAFQGRLLKRASEICGGYNALRAHLGVSEHVLKQWLEGKVPLPERAFLKAADIVLEDDIARAQQDRRGAPRVAAIGTGRNKNG